MWDEDKVKKELKKSEKELKGYTIGTMDYTYTEAEIATYKKVLQIEG